MDDIQTAYWENFTNNLEVKKRKWENISEKFLQEFVTEDKWVLNKFNNYKETLTFTKVTEEDKRKREAIAKIMDKKQMQPQRKFAKKSQREKQMRQ